MSTDRATKIVEVAGAEDSRLSGLDEDSLEGFSKLCRLPSPSLSSQQEELLVNRRLETAACAYASEMTRRLEAHRQTLELRLLRHRSFIHQEAAFMGTGSWAQRVTQQLQQERSKLVRQQEVLRERLQAAAQETDVLQQLKASLHLNNSHWRAELTSAQKKLAEAELQRRSYLPPLEAQVRELMLRLDSHSETPPRAVA